MIVGTPFIGKDYCLEDYIEGLRSSTHKDLEFIWIDNSLDKKFRKKLDKYAKEFKATIYDCDFPHFKRTPKNQEVKRRAVARMMNFLNSKRPKGKDMLLLEDDHKVFPETFTRLETLANMGEEIGAVTAVMYTRNEMSSNNVNHGNWEFTPTIPGEPEMMVKQRAVAEKEYGIEQIGYSGTGCIYYKAEFLDNYTFNNSEVSIGQDMNATYHISQIMKKKLLVDWSQKIPHYDFYNNSKVVYDSVICAKPLVSIILFAKKSKELSQVKKDIGKQSFDNYEIVEETGGDIADCINRAIERAKGKILVFTESDCRIPNTDWLDNIVKYTKPNKIYFGQQLSSNVRNFGNTSMYKNTALLKKLNNEYKWANDTEWFLELQRKGVEKVEINENPVYHLKKSHPEREKEHEQERQRIIKEYLEYSEWVNNEIK